MNDPKNIHLFFDARTLDYIVNCIAQRPYIECAPVLRDIEAQVQGQGSTNGKAPVVGASEALPVVSEVVGASPH